MNKNSQAGSMSVVPMPWNSNYYDFIDFGCGAGGNVQFIQTLWPKLRGVGIDIDPRKIERAKAAGHEAVVFDILKLPSKKMTRFVTMSHFLEHLGSVVEAASMIRKGIEVAEEFVFIRQPYFDADGFLLQHGLKFYWSHWRGHRSKMSAIDFYSILRSERDAATISSFRIFGRGIVTSSEDSTVIPLSAPIDQHHYDPAKHGNKSAHVFFPIPVFKEIVAIADIRITDRSRELLARLGSMCCLYDSES